MLFQVVESAVAFLLPFTHELFLEKRKRALGQRARRVYSRFIQSPVRSFDIFGKDIFLVTKPARWQRSMKPGSFRSINGDISFQLNPGSQHAWVLTSCSSTSSLISPICSRATFEPFGLTSANLLETIPSDEVWKKKEEVAYKEKKVKSVTR